MRIAIIAEVYLPKIDGVVIRTLNLIRQLRSLGHQVLVFCPQVEGERNSPVPVVEFASYAFPMYPEYQVGRPDQTLTAELVKFEPDVVHFINPFAFGFRCYDQLAAAGLALPTVFSFHTYYAEFVKRYGVLRPMSGLLWWLTKLYHNQASLNLTVSDITRGDLTARGFERVRLWQPAVDSDLFHPDQACTRMRARLCGTHERRHLLLTVSRLAPEKNVEFLRDVLNRIPDAQLAVVGDGPHRSSLEKYFRDLPVTFVGYLKGEQLAQAYASADAFAYASETETMGNVILEAMGCGLPIVAPRAGGIPSLVTHEQSALLFSPGDADAAARDTQRVLSDESLRAQLTQQARVWAQEHSWRQAAKRVCQDYKEAISLWTDGTGRTSPRASLASAGPLGKLVTTGLTSMFRLVSKLTTRSGTAKTAAESPAVTVTQQHTKQYTSFDTENAAQDATADASHQGVDPPQQTENQKLAATS